MSAIPPVAEQQPVATEASRLVGGQVEGAAAVVVTDEAEDTTDNQEINLQDLNFDLQLVLDGFTQCKGEDGQLYLDGYLRAYSELNKYSTP